MVKIKSGRYYHVEDHIFLIYRIYIYLYRIFATQMPQLNNLIVPFGKTCTEYLPQEDSEPL